MLELSLFPYAQLKPLGCLPASPQEASCQLVPLGNFQEVISSKFPLQSQIPHTVFITGTALRLWKPDLVLSTRPHASDSL